MPGELFGRIRWEGDLHRERLDEPESLIATMRGLIDSSVWIDHLRGVRTRETAILDELFASLDPELDRGDREAAADLLIGDLVLCEVLRGISGSARARGGQGSLLSFEVVTIGGVDLALEAADHYRALRRLGVTVRKTIDLLIGT